MTFIAIILVPKTPNRKFNSIGNVVLVPVVKEILQSVKAHQSSAADFKGGVSLGNTVDQQTAHSPS